MSNPTTSARQAADSIAQVAAAEEAAGPPWPVSDLTGQDASPTASSPPEAENQEEVWEFSENIRTEGDLDAKMDFDEKFHASDLTDDFGKADPGTTGAADEPIGVQAEAETELAIEAGVEGADGSGSQLAAQSEGPGTSAESGVEAGHDDSSFGSVDDFSSLMEDEASHVSLEAGSSPSRVPGDDGDAGVPISKRSACDLGEPESWDLASGADFAPPKASNAGRIDSVSSGSASARTADLAADKFPTKYAEEIGEASAVRTALVRFCNLVGWIFTIVAVAFVAYLNIEPDWRRLVPTTQTLSIDSVVAETTDSGWVESTRSGSLLIVNGLATNTGEQAIWPPNLWVAMLDDKGQRIMNAGVAVGEPLAESILREASPGELERATARARQGFVATPMRSGEVRAFQAVIGQLPEGAGRMLLEVVEAQ